MPELDDLKLEIQALKIVVNNLKTKETNRLKKNYDSTYNTLRGAILKTSDIENTIDNTYEKLGIAGLFEDLIVINNPYGNALGFKFSKVIEANVKNILINSLSKLEGDDGNNGRKKRLMRIIKKVINNPIADAVLNSNPVGSAVSNIINVASGFVNTTWKKVGKKTIGKGLKEIALTTRDEISADKLKLFKESIQKYADFYVAMLEVTQKFGTRIDFLKNSFESTYVAFKDLHRNYLETLGISKEGKQFIQLDNLFEKKNESNEEFDYSTILEKEEIVKGLEFIRKLGDTEKLAERFSNEFAKAIRDFVNDYIEILKIPINNNWTADEINIKKLNLVITKLERFLQNNVEIETLETTTDNFAMVSFSSKMKKYKAYKA